jgi:hypothetical protein
MTDKNATPVPGAVSNAMVERREAEERSMQDYRWGNLTPLGVANHLRRAGFNLEYATAKANALAPVEAVATEPVGYDAKREAMDFYPPAVDEWGDDPVAEDDALQRRIFDFICNDVLPSYDIASVVARNDSDLVDAIRTIFPIAPTGDSGALREALEKIATLNRSRDQLQEIARAALKGEPGK